MELEQVPLEFDKEIIIKQDAPPLWLTIINFAALSSALLGAFYWSCILSFELNSDEANVALSMILFGACIGIPSLLTYRIIFDFYNKQWKTEGNFLFFRFGKWTPLNEVEYISLVYQKYYYWNNPQRGAFVGYDINLWHGQKHYTIYQYINYNAAKKAGLKLATQLHVNLLDCSDPLSKKWLYTKN